MTGSIYSNFRAIGDMRLIQTLGYDVGDDAITLSASSGKQGESGDTLLLRREGESILRAMDGLQSYSTQGQLFFDHARYVVVGRDAAERGIGELLDFVERDEGLRLGAELFILENGSAGDLVMGPGDDSYDITEVLSSVKRDAEQRAISHVGNFRETAVALSEYGAAPVCLLRTVETEGSVKLEENGLSALPVGYAILKSDQLAGTLIGETAEALSLMLGYSGIITRTFPDGRGGRVTLRFDGTDHGLKPSWNADGTPGPVEARLRVRAAVAETDASEATDLDFLAGQLRASLVQNLRELLALSQSLDADFLALSQELRLSGGARFPALPDHWLETLEFHIAVDAVIDLSYDLNETVETKGAESAP